MTPSVTEGTQKGASEAKASLQSDLSGDLLLKGLPPGWRARVVGKGTGQIPPNAGVPENDRARRNSRKLIPAKAGTASALPPSAQTPEEQSGTQKGTQILAETSAPPEMSHSRILLPVPSRMGIAAYQSGDRLVIVIDSAEPMDTSALRGDGIFSTLSVDTIADATLVSVRIPDTRRLYLSQQSNGWVLGDEQPPGNDYGDRRVINPRIVPEGLLFPMRRPGRVLAIKDPASGAPLLIGTSAADDGGMLSLRKSKDYDVWPSLEGVVVDDHAPPKVEIKPGPLGDVLSVAGKQFPDPSEAVFASDVDLKWLGLKNLPTQKLEQRYRQAIIDAADSEPAKRFEKRIEAARAAFSLGAFPDARAIMTVALEDDPEEAFKPDVRFFLGAVELMNGNMDGASLLDGAWPEGDKRATQVWRGIYYSALGGRDQDAAHYLATDFERLLNYPEPLRSAILPGVSEEIARYGTAADRAALKSMPTDDAAYKFAGAIADLQDGKKDAAHSEINNLALDKDPVVSEKALEKKISMDVDSGLISPDTAAEMYGSIIPDARLAGREGVPRLLQADVYMAQRKWEKALGAIDLAQRSPSRQVDPSLAPKLYATLAGIAREAMDNITSHGASQNALLQSAAMLRAHIADMAPGIEKGTVLTDYGRMLLNLGLADEATQAFSDAIPMIDSEADRAIAGEGLADAFIQRGMLNDASEALANTGARNLPPEIVSGRNRVAARIALSSGKPEISLYLLNGDNNAVAADMRGRIHESREEWSPAVSDVRKIVEAQIPAEGAMTVDQQLLALRFASDASRAGDVGALKWISDRIGDRQFDSETEKMFRLLVSVN
ncbi:hypothetical protein AA14337_3296 [Acetobacter malorum DSM 14337]|uniref:Uncharacterized protein n=1 Tax=Acetobacter malorum DSM 14337 TaxID=1307910 RepID=A0ABQ0Q0S1_9PROT|nr:hypothetical protein AA14337_3296 [Acetobacter malorum DSM 14337]